MLKKLKLQDSYQKRLVGLGPEDCVQPSVLKIYSCGPTVYNYQSIGNMRAIWLPDIIARTAKMLGWEVQWVCNITDVGHLVGDGDEGQDKIERGAKRDRKTVSQIVDYYTQNFVEQCKSLNFRLPKDKYRPKASDYIAEQMLLALELLQKKLAYPLKDGIYFDFEAYKKQFAKDTRTQKNYLKNILEQISKQQGDTNYTGRKITNTLKSNKDFALWKFVEEDSLQKWKFLDFEIVRDFLEKFSLEIDKKILRKWGSPGWHSECVAMITEILGEKPITKLSRKRDEDIKKFQIDIHTGGEDHIDIHHQNEILQSEALGFGLSKYWIHNKYVIVNGSKMSKSLGNVYTVIGEKSQTGFESISEKGYDPLAYRMMLMEHHYSEQMNFTWEKLTQSQTRLFNLRKEIAKIRSFYWSRSNLFDLKKIQEKLLKNSNSETETKTEIEEKQKDFYLSFLLDDLNTPKFVEKYQSLVIETANFIQTKGRLNQKNFGLIKYIEKEFLELGLFPIIPTIVYNLGSKRDSFKKLKEYQKADEIRDQINQKGFQVDDYKWGFGFWQKNTTL